MSFIEEDDDNEEVAVEDSALDSEAIVFNRGKCESGNAAIVVCCFSSWFQSISLYHGTQRMVLFAFLILLPLYRAAVVGKRMSCGTVSCTASLQF